MPIGIWGPVSCCVKVNLPFLRSFIRRRRIKMQSAYLLSKHPNILHTSDEFFSGVYNPKTSKMKKSVQFNSVQFRCDSVDSTDFPWIQQIFDGTRVFISPCFQCARFLLRCLGGNRPQKKKSVMKVLPKYVK